MLARCDLISMVTALPLQRPYLCHHPASVTTGSFVRMLAGWVIGSSQVNTSD